MKNDGIFLRVLGYVEEDGNWAAHCLETDLVGYGKTFESALKSLVELTAMQISFAQFKKQPSLLDHPAPPHIFETWGKMNQLMLQNYLGKQHVDSGKRISSIPLPKPSKKATFTPLYAH
jgi:hypothetical protein